MAALTRSVKESPRKKRTNTGCLTCRERRVKCNEATPVCFHCVRLSLKCEWGVHIPLKDRKEQKATEARRRRPLPLLSKTSTSTPTPDASSSGPFVLAQIGFGSSPDNGPSMFGSVVGDGVADTSGFLPVASNLFEALAPSFLFYPSPTADMEIATTGLLSSLPSLRPFTNEDHQALDYYQKEIVFGFGSKSPAWSTHAILMKTACKSSAVLHLLLAACLAEMGWLSNDCRPMLDTAGEHYRIGRQLLEGEIADSWADPLVIMASFWFLYLQQRRRSAKTRIVYRELSRLMCDYFSNNHLCRILSSSPPERHQQQSGGNDFICSADRKALLARLAVWLFWADAQSCFQGDGGSMARLLAGQGSSQGILDLYDVSRETLQLHWEGQYPDEELIDDVKNAGALELVHLTWVLVQEINEATETSIPMNPGISREIKSRMDAVRRKYPISSVFRFANSTARVRDRLMANSDWAVANYYALCIYHFRCSLAAEDEDGGAVSMIEGTTETSEALLMLIQKTLETDDRGQTDRMQWPLFWAGVEMTDPFKQNWILAKLKTEGLHEALQMVLLKQLGGRRIGIGIIRQICQEACADIFETGLDMYSM
ncbi:hypothetical protein B0H63DRAFT_305584 [Podospora didyma]|uniref:Zn(2)-C6 fungal-type domain-containing protein n=1 Tax=Podospora didyma TaxID=330526 RepID=A0AAE0K5H1_9PEZI|nr:hypothetical protein B0H63DRAFT_305584 [Podospora didyma]